MLGSIVQRIRQSVNASSSSGSPRSGGRSSSNKMSRYKTSGTALTAINEGDEYCTLQDVLNHRGSWLRAEELWALCRECCLTLLSISDCTELVQGLCVMLETLAFDSLGHVCFTDIEIEPDPHYAPPEYREIGNSCKGHVYSLGMLIHEASAYNPTAASIPQHSARLRKLLNSMMESEYSERIGLDGVVKECDLYFLSAGVGSSHDICKHIVSSVSQKGSERGSTEEINDIDEREVSADSTSSIVLPSMSLQDLVEKYTSDRLKDELAGEADSTRDISAAAANVSTDSSILSPPSQFGAKYTTGGMIKSSSSICDSSSSAFVPKESSEGSMGRRSADNMDEEDGVFAEGATLKAGNAPLRLPDAYRSTATHFSPIVLSNQEKKSSPSRAVSSSTTKDERTSRNLKELKKQLLKQHSSQEVDTKQSPRQSFSPESTTSHSSPSKAITSMHTKPIISKPSMSESKDKPVPSAPPVTHAVRPLPRKQHIAESSDQSSVPNNTPFTHATTQHPVPMPHMVQTSPSTAQSTPARVADSVQSTIPTNPHTNQPLLVNSTTMVPQYPGVPLMLQRDSATGAVSWLPVVSNMPYWALPPQQASAVIQPVSQPAATPPAPPISELASQPVSASVPASLPQASNGEQPANATTLSSAQNASATTPNNSTGATTPNSSTGATTPNNNIGITPPNNTGVTTPNNNTGITTPNASPNDAHTSRMHTTANKRRSNARSEPKKQASDTTSHTAQAAATVTELPSGALTTTSNSTSSNRAAEKSAASAQLNVTVKRASKEKRQTSSEKDSRAKEAVKKQPHQKLLVLTQIRQLLKNEFAFDGYMNHGKEDVEMAEFIVSLHLPALDFTNWCNIIVAKYGDLYWSEELLVSLYHVIHGHKPDIDRPPSGALRAKSARVLSVDEPGTNPTAQSVSKRVPASPFRPIALSASDLGVSAASSTPRKTKRSSLVKPKAMLPQVHQSEGGSVDVAVTHSPLSFSLSRLKSASVQDLARQLTVTSASLTKSKSQSLLQTESRDSRDLTPLVKSLILPNGGTREVMYIEGKQANPLLDDMLTNRAASTSAFEQESDSHSHSSASELRVKGRLHNYSLASSLGAEDFTDSAFGSRLSSEYESDNSLANHSQAVYAQTTICSTVVYASYMTENREAVSMLADKTENKSVDGVKKKIADLSQQISVNSKRRNKACKYIRKIHSSASHKGADYKSMLPAVHAEYEDAVTQLNSLAHAKLQLEVLLAEQSSIEVACLFSFTKPSRPLLVIDTKENPRLHFQTQIDGRTKTEKEVLYAGERYGLLSYLYAAGALEDGYILDFFHSYRYLIAAKDVMAFITEKYNAAKELKACDIRTKVMNRSLDLLTFWVSCYYSADFILSPPVVETLVNFLQDEVLSEHHAECAPLLRLLDDYENDKSKNSTFVHPLPSNDTLPYLDEDHNSAAKKWNAAKSVLTVASGRSTVLYLKTPHGIFLHSKAKKAAKEFSHPTMPRNADGFSITDFSPNEIAEQLTMVEQEFFRNIHPVNFMNTLAQGIGASLAGSTNDAIPSQEKKPLFYTDYVQIQAVTDMIQHSKKVAHWVTAEIISSTNSKSQTVTVNKFIQVAKISKDLRNYATAMSVKDGLDHPLIRLIPAWKDVPSKLMLELDDMKLALKTDSAFIQAPADNPDIPTVPCALLFSLHVQQLERGGFTLSNGMYRWPKLRSLARLVDSIRLCKNYSYKFSENAELRELLHNRRCELYTHSLENLVMASGADNSRASYTPSSRWSNVIKRVKGKFT